MEDNKLEKDDFYRLVGRRVEFSRKKDLNITDNNKIMDSTLTLIEHLVARNDPNGEELIISQFNMLKSYEVKGKALRDTY